MEQPVLVAVAIAAYIVVRHWAARRLSKGDRRATWVFFAPAIAGALVGVWAGLQVATFSPLLGVALVVVSGVTGALLIRGLRINAAVLGPASAMPTPWVDYFIWVALAMPIILIVTLLALAVAGQLR